jgi:hypothetical protein
MGEEIAQQWIGNASQAFRPGRQARLAVNTQTQDLGLDPIKPVDVGLVRRDLARSDWRPGQGEEGQHNVAFAEVIAQAYHVFLVAFEAKLGRDVSNFKYHFVPRLL